MLWHTKNGRLCIDGAATDYICFGSGTTPLILIPGVGDGLKTVKGTALPMAALYRAFAPRFRVYAFSRRDPLPAGFSTRDMARDLGLAMAALDIQTAHVVGVSQGGMIAQYLAVDRPETVGRLVLAVTLCRPNESIRQVVGNWLTMAAAGDYTGIFTDTAERSYTGPRRWAYRALAPLLCRLTRPKSLDRFIVQAESCVRHDASDLLDQIASPTLVIGGGRDQIVGTEAAQELAAGIPNSRLFVYERFGHGVYEEAGDFNRRILTFLLEA